MRAIDERKSLGRTRGIMRDQHCQFFKCLLVNLFLKTRLPENEVSGDSDGKEDEGSPQVYTFPFAVLIKKEEYDSWLQNRPFRLQLNRSYLFVLHFVIIIKVQQKHIRSLVAILFQSPCISISAQPPPQNIIVLMITREQIGKFAVFCCSICTKKISQTANHVIIICKQEHIICQKCFESAKGAFTCPTCQITCQKRTTLRCMWRKPLVALYNACQVEVKKVGMVGPQLAKKIGKLKAIQERMGQLQERQARVLEKLTLSDSFKEPDPSQYQSTHKKLIEETQIQSFTFALNHRKTVTSAYKQKIDQKYDEILSISARLQAQAKELSENLEQIKQTNKELINDNQRYDKYFSQKGELQYSV